MEPHALRHFELRELCYFVAVAEELHFARAAERVGINQSPLSKAITLMERQLGVRLFVRDRRSTQLTPVGEVLLADARRILAATSQARQSVLAAAQGRTGRLRIAMGDGLAHPRLSVLLRATQSENSGIDVQAIKCGLSEQLTLLRSRILDVGFVATAPELHSLISTEHLPTSNLHGLGDDIHATPIWKDKVVVVLDRTQPLAAQTEIDWQALEVMDLVLGGEHSANSVIPCPLVDLSGRVRRLRFVTSIELLLTLVAAGNCVGLIGSEMAKMIHRDDLAFRQLNTRRPKVTTWLLQRKDDESPLIASFVDRAQRSA